MKFGDVQQELAEILDAAAIKVDAEVTHALCVSGLSPYEANKALNMMKQAGISFVVDNDKPQYQNINKVRRQLGMPELKETIMPSQTSTQVLGANRAHEFMVGSNVDYVEKAKSVVVLHVYQQMEKTGASPFDVYVVWFCKTLQHWKALVGTTLADNLYYEVTYNGDKNEYYLDEYSKVSNIVIPG